jgi:VWFA-related protein
MQSRLVSLLAAAFLFTVLTSRPALGQVSRSQSSPEERPRLKDFGRSLKKLKWDPVTGAAIESAGSTGRRKSTNDDDVIRIETDLVVSDVQVRDRKGAVVTGLILSDFSVTEDGVGQHIGHFSLGDDLTVGRSIVLIIDYSGSLRRYIDKSIDAAEILIDKLGPKDSIAIVTDDVALLVDFTRDRLKLRQALESLRKKTSAHKYGLSFQFSALMATVKELFDEEDIRPIVIFQTDGDEVELLQPPDPGVFFLPEPSTPGRRPYKSQVKQFSLKDVYHEVEKSRVTIYTVIPGTSLIGLSVEEQLKKMKSSGLPPGITEEYLALQIKYTVRAQMAAAGAAIVSGGWTAFLNKPEQAADIYSTILADINSRYVIGYYPSSKVHDGKRHNVLIEVRGHPEYVVSGRKSYYAPRPDR